MVKIYWINSRLATAGLHEIESIKEDIEKISVMDFKDGELNNKELWHERTMDIISKLIDGKRVVIFCHAGISRSNAMALTVLIHFGYNLYEAIGLIRQKVLIAQISPELIDDIKSWYKWCI